MTINAIKFRELIEAYERQERGSISALQDYMYSHRYELLALVTKETK